MNINKCLLLLLCSITFNTIAQDKTKSPKSTTLPIDLIADKASYNQDTGIATYAGNIKVTQGSSTIWADKLTVTIKNNSAEILEASGNPVKFEYQGKRQPVRGKALKVTYKIADKTITLSGSAEITQGKDKVRGALLAYNLDKETIRGSRVKMTFLPPK
ncbi:MAG: lipopolysaccharide transport periplasmic protein LptA [Gammaproteobacteria bacterium]|nr:lipopolysaccharide transport periplasmic protein LptA [Gammaproteobacteria bacterium]